VKKLELWENSFGAIMYFGSSNGRKELFIDKSVGRERRFGFYGIIKGWRKVERSSEGAMKIKAMNI
jgi:hypothetical protein